MPWLAARPEETSEQKDEWGVAVIGPGSIKIGARRRACHPKAMIDKDIPEVAKDATEITVMGLLFLQYAMRNRFGRLTDRNAAMAQRTHRRSDTA